MRRMRRKRKEKMRMTGGQTMGGQRQEKEWGDKGKRRRNGGKQKMETYSPLSAAFSAYSI
jgi:hypothetical protein